jgi:MFS family permease
MATVSTRERTQPVLPVVSSPAAPAVPETRQPEQGAKAGTFKSLRHRNFQIYVGGQLVSLAGAWMQIVAQGWLVYELSRSEAMLGLVGFVSAIPALFTSPWAGVVADRMSKRRLLMATQIASMLLSFVMAALTLTGIIEVWHILVLAVLFGMINAIDGPTRQAFVVDMVGRDDLPNAIALNSMTFNAARVVGPAIGGVLLATVGAGWCFLLNGFSFLAVIASLMMMRLTAGRGTGSQASPWSQLKEGVAYTAHQPQLRALILLALFFSTFGISFMTVLPAYVDRVLNVGPAAFGLLTAAMGVGAVTGAFLLARYGDKGFRGRWLFGAAMSFPFVLAIFAYSPSLPLSLFLAMLLGIGFMSQFTLINTLLQTLVVDQMRGRVMGLYTLTFFGLAPFGNLAIGALAESIGLSLTLSLSAAMSLITAIAIFWWTPSLRTLE